jgi:hypothetical protein
MAAMVFKRAVFEIRKRPKGVLRPKQQTNLKEVALVTAFSFTDIFKDETTVQLLCRSLIPWLILLNVLFTKRRSRVTRERICAFSL